ncbi:class I SAM-dependent methyltransferase [Paraburkholderia lycopersici]|uniref:Methyltransferase domain-containing protein n=1 Tax=Paraburkholderia lycopersici TaxID=416944 RepID=A0A1G6WAV0_9BURK|nr:Methyltransferase domain-containing protein [Paraburkholderia lycopersici]
MILADIGTGDGLVGFRAIERVGASIRVLITDISTPLLRHTEESAQSPRVRGQCAFVHGSAGNLDGIANDAVDAATMRVLLAYER